MTLPQVQRVALSVIKSNPDNPRIIKDERFAGLVRSLQEFPAMLELRPIVVDANYMVLGGNQRLKAAKEAGFKTVPVIVADQFTNDQKQEFIIKDNVSAGTFSWSAFFDQGEHWDVHALMDWGLELPFMPNTDPKQSRDKVTDADVDKANQKLVVAFNDQKDLREVTCPHCGEDFHVDA